MSELKACPFCDVNEWKYQSHFSGTTIYQCEKCGTIVDESVINTRPIEDALNARIAKLVNLVEVQHDDNCHLADMCRERDARIAELEATIDQLIAAGESLTRVAEWRYANLTELLAWDTLVEKIHKEREK